MYYLCGIQTNILMEKGKEKMNFKKSTKLSLFGEITLQTLSHF